MTMFYSASDERWLQEKRLRALEGQVAALQGAMKPDSVWLPEPCADVETGGVMKQR